MFISEQIRLVFKHARLIAGQKSLHIFGESILNWFLLKQLSTRFNVFINEDADTIAKNLIKYCNTTDVEVVRFNGLLFFEVQINDITIAYYPKHKKAEDNYEKFAIDSVTLKEGRESPNMGKMYEATKEFELYYKIDAILIWKFFNKLKYISLTRLGGFTRRSIMHWDLKMLTDSIFHWHPTAEKTSKDVFITFFTKMMYVNYPIETISKAWEVIKELPAEDRALYTYLILYISNPEIVDYVRWEFIITKAQNNKRAEYLDIMGRLLKAKPLTHNLSRFHKELLLKIYKFKDDLIFVKAVFKFCEVFDISFFKDFTAVPEFITDRNWFYKNYSKEEIKIKKSEMIQQWLHS